MSIGSLCIIGNRKNSGKREAGQMYRRFAIDKNVLNTFCLECLAMERMILGLENNVFEEFVGIGGEVAPIFK
jgi:hypothetical protein